nr:uncharacterized protein CI109_003340 [Kwoniella shandongensis]KAA5528440.1 hypothetical protein CI109_003340 [Kwoniella shandongensis]
MPVSYPCTPYNTPDLRYWPCRRNLRKGSDASTPQVAKESAPSPAPIKADQTSSSPPFIVLTNPYLILPNGQLSPNTSLCIDKDTGLLTALPPQAVEKGLVKEIDLGGKWVSPGMIDIQVNGSWSCSFSSSDKDQEFYEQNVKKVSAKLCKLGVTSHNNGEVQTPWFLINGYTLHQIPLAAKLAYEAHPTCCVLASGAPHLVKPPSKSHFLSNEEKFKRRETRVGGLYLEGTGIWIGWVTWLLEAVFQLSSIAHISVPQAIVCATYNPANMLGGEVKQKVGFRPGCWADLVIWDPKGQGRQGIKGVWKGGKEVWYEA